MQHGKHGMDEVQKDSRRRHSAKFAELPAAHTRTTLNSEFVQFDFPVDYTWDNTTFATYLCGNMSSIDSGLGLGSLFIRIDIGTYILPSCAFNLLANVSNLQLNGIIISGNATYPDPLVRLANAMDQDVASLTLFFKNGHLLNPDGSRYQIVWATVFQSYPTLSLFSLSGTYIGATTLPSFPSTISSFDVSNCGIIATLPDTLLNQTVTGISLWKVLQVDFSENQIYGAIPKNFLSATGPVTELSLSFRSNNLSGSIPDMFGSKPWASVTTSLSLDFSVNKLTALPSHLVPANCFPQVLRIFLDFHNNLLTGTIPATLIQDAFTIAYNLDIELQSNMLTGGLPSGLLLLNTTVGGTLAPIEDFKLYVSFNSLSGTIGPDLFTVLNWTSMEYFEFKADSNALTGGLPTALIGSGNAPNLKTLYFDVSENPSLTGTVPSTLIGSLAGDPSPAPSKNLTARFELYNTGLTGTLTIPGFPLRSTAVKLAVEAFNSSFTSLVIEDSAFDAINYLGISDNSQMTGTLPDSLFNASSVLIGLEASNTALNGTLPDLGRLKPTFLIDLYLVGTFIDVCSTPRSLWNVGNTEVFCGLPDSFTCPGLYPAACSEVPTAPIDCAASTRPDPSWKCVGGAWTYQGLFTNSTIVIPSGSVSTIINGGLNSSTIVFQGVGGTLTITDGCAKELTSIVVELTPAQLSALSTKTPYTLLSYPDTCSTPSLSITARTSGCKKVKVKTINASGTLSALFSIDSSKCNTWWIVLVSVVCGVIVLTAIVLAVVITLVPAARNKLLPYRQRSHTHTRITRT